MASLRQRLSSARQNVVIQVNVASSLNVQNLQLQERDATTGNWTSTGADGSIYSVTKRGFNSGEGLELPSLTVKNGVGRFAN